MTENEPNRVMEEYSQLASDDPDERSDEERFRGKIAVRADATDTVYPEGDSPFEAALYTVRFEPYTHPVDDIDHVVAGCRIINVETITDSEELRQDVEWGLRFHLG